VDAFMEVMEIDLPGLLTVNRYCSQVQTVKYN